MNLLQDRRALTAAGTAIVLLAGVLIAIFLTRGVRKPAEENIASNSALQVQLGEQTKVDPSRKLRCFVGGQFVGEATLADCAKKNGVSAQALDVGVDPSGALSAAGSQPPPPPAQAQPPAPTLPAAPAVTAPASAPSTGECLRFGADGWRSTGAGAVSLSACVQSLFAGRCERAGEALYGRWGGQTLRLVPGRVELSPDNRDFHTLAEQGRDCSIPSL